MLSSSSDLFLEENCEPILYVEDGFGQLMAILVPPTHTKREILDVSLAWYFLLTRLGSIMWI